MKRLAPQSVESHLHQLAQHATDCLIEVNLTPKPGLVDRRGSGAHQDLSLALMERSARSLTPTFMRWRNSAGSVQRISHCAKPWAALVAKGSVR